MDTEKQIPVVDKEGHIVHKPFKNKEKIRSNANYSRYLNLGFYLIIPLLGGVFLGAQIDNWLHTKHIFVLIGIIIGAIASFYNLFKLTQDVTH